MEIVGIIDRRFCVSTLNFAWYTGMIWLKNCPVQNHTFLSSNIYGRMYQWHLHKKYKYRLNYRVQHVYRTKKTLIEYRLEWTNKSMIELYMHAFKVSVVHYLVYGMVIRWRIISGIWNKRCRVNFCLWNNVPFLN